MNGVVRLKLYKGNVNGRRSQVGRFAVDPTIATFEDDGGAYNPEEKTPRASSSSTPCACIAANRALSRARGFRSYSPAESCPRRGIPDGRRLRPMTLMSRDRNRPSVPACCARSASSARPARRYLRTRTGRGCARRACGRGRREPSVDRGITPGLPSMAVFGEEYRELLSHGDGAVRLSRSNPDMPARPHPGAVPPRRAARSDRRLRGRAPSCRWSIRRSCARQLVQRRLPVFTIIDRRLVRMPQSITNRRRARVRRRRCWPASAELLTALGAAVHRHLNRSFLTGVP